MWQTALLCGFRLVSFPDYKSNLVIFSLRKSQISPKALFGQKKNSAKKIAKSDHYRLLRALEIFRLTGKPRAAFLQQEKLREKYDFTTIILERPRHDLYKRIEARVDKMFEQGLEAEARRLMQKYGADAPGMKAIGYREFSENAASASPLELEAIKERIKRDSKKYAKKQYVFTAGIPGAKTIQMTDAQDAIAEILCGMPFAL